jgi:hypothetical protein
MKSTMKGPTRRFTLGAGIRWRRQSRRNLRSSALRVGASSITSVTEIPFPRARSSAASHSSRGSTRFRSRRVRTGVVTGMRSRRTVSRSTSVRDRCTAIPRAGRGWRPIGTVTWIGPGHEGRRSHSSAALRWLSAAPEPHAFTAASQRPYRLRARWPTAYTPRCSRCSRRALTRRWIPGLVRPEARSSAAARTPWSCRASSAIRASAVPVAGLGRIAIQSGHSRGFAPWVPPTGRDWRPVE